MTKDQKLGQFRALLTTLAGVLIAWGFTDEHGWMPVIGVLLALFSLIGGIRTHLDKTKPGGIAWSLVRKVANAAGAAAVTYGFTSPEQSESMSHLIGAAGPILAGFFSWIDNDQGDFGPPGVGPGVGMILMLLAGVFLLPSCGITFTEDGCILGKYEKDGNAYYAGPCVGADTDGDGEADIDRYRVQWGNGSGDLLRATYTKAGGEVVIEYLANSGIWVGWSSKSGVTLGPVPPEVEKALEGNPEPVDEPIVLPLMGWAPTGDHQDDGWRRKEPVMISNCRVAKSGYGSGFMLRDRGFESRPCYQF